MAIRLGEHVVSGLIDNRRPHMTRGSLCLNCSEGEGPVDVRFDLTGDCGADLRGKFVRFWCACNPWECPDFDREAHKGFQWRQIGPTGRMTASGWVRAMPCGPEEFLHRARLGEAPPTPWVRHLYLEWYGQNGRVLVEMADPLVEWRPDEPKIIDRPLEPDEIWIPLPNLAVMPECARKDAPPAGLEITQISLEDGAPIIEHWTACAKHVRDNPRHDPMDDLIEEASMLDAVLADDSDPDMDDDLWDDREGGEDFVDELKIMDLCLAKKGDSLVDLFSENPPPPEHALDDNAVESQLKLILAQLAIFNISLDICEHYTYRDAYRMLTEQILPEGSFHPEMLGSGWVQHFHTKETCPQCQEKFGRAFDGESED